MSGTKKAAAGAAALIVPRLEIAMRFTAVKDRPGVLKVEIIDQQIPIPVRILAQQNGVLGEVVFDMTVQGAGTVLVYVPGAPNTELCAAIEIKGEIRRSYYLWNWFTDKVTRTLIPEYSSDRAQRQRLRASRVTMTTGPLNRGDDSPIAEMLNK